MSAHKTLVKPVGHNRTSPCCARRTPDLTPPRIDLLWAPLRSNACICRHARPIFERIQAQHKKRRSEISPINAAVEQCWTAFVALRPQGFCQVPVAPPPRQHSFLYQNSCLQLPFANYFRFVLSHCGLKRFCFNNEIAINRRGTTDSAHSTHAPCSTRTEKELETYLTHFFSFCLYHGLTPIEVKSHA